MESSGILTLSAIDEDFKCTNEDTFFVYFIKSTIDGMISQLGLIYIADRDVAA